MAKYFCGITAGDDKYTISILDDNLNVIFIDNLELNRLIELLKRKSISIISIDAPVTLYLKQAEALNGKYPDKIIIKKRPFDNIISSKNLLTYSDRFNISKNKLESLVKLVKQLNKLNFTIRVSGETEKAIIESYPDTSFLALGCSLIRKTPPDDIPRQKVEFLRGKGVRLNNLLKKIKDNLNEGIDTLCQAYTAYLYHGGQVTILGDQREGLLVIPVKNAVPQDSAVKNKPTVIINESDKIPVSINVNRANKEIKVITEYCGAQYLYTNTDGVIRIDDLRPIKSYRPFTEIYEIKHIRMVQVIIGTTDGLRKVKAYLIPNQESTNSFRAANDEDKKKLDSFWGIHGDKRGYLIKFNRVDVVKA